MYDSIFKNRMVMKKYTKWIISLATGMLMLSSCDSYLDLKPTSSLSDADIQTLLNSNNSTKVALVLSQIANGLDGYFRLAGTFNGFSGGDINNICGQDFYQNLRGNDIVFGTSDVGVSGDALTLYYMDNTATMPWLSSNTNYNMAFWSLPASIPMNANKVMKYITADIANNSTVAAVKKGRAQALCVRAYGYMLLMERYRPAYLHGGKDSFGMPLYTDYLVNSPAKISSATETYDFIKSDLNEAISLFKAADASAKGYTTAIPNDIDMGVAQYLLARVSLETGDYTTCIAACQDILSHYPSLITETNYGVKASDFDALQAQTKEAKADNNAFLNITVNPECILGWVNGSGAMTYQNLDFNPFLGYGETPHPTKVRTDDYLYGLMDDRDFRKDNTLARVVNFTFPTYKGSTITETWAVNTNLKWGATIMKGITTRQPDKYDCDYIYFRSSEVLLMLAEAQYMNNSEADAKTTLNKLLTARTKSGSTTLTCSNYDNGAYASKTLDLIKLQWRIEMWGENGMDFYNSKRWDTPIDRSKSTLHWSASKSLPVDDMTYGIPDIEYQRDSNWPSSAYK